MTQAGVTLEKLEALFPFELDGFQRRAVQALLEGKSAVVCAPTGVCAWLLLSACEACARAALEWRGRGGGKPVVGCSGCNR